MQHITLPTDNKDVQYIFDRPNYEKEDMKF